jgi:hypothetical protein
LSNVAIFFFALFLYEATRLQAFLDGPHQDRLGKIASDLVVYAKDELLMNRLPDNLALRLAKLAGFVFWSPELFRGWDQRRVERAMSSLEQKSRNLDEALSTRRALRAVDVGISPMAMPMPTMEIGGDKFIQASPEAQQLHGVAFRRITSKGRKHTWDEVHCIHSHMDWETGEPLIPVGNTLMVAKDVPFGSYKVHVISTGTIEDEVGERNADKAFRQSKGFVLGTKYRYACVECLGRQQKKKQQQQQEEEEEDDKEKQRKLKKQQGVQALISFF